MPDMSAFPCLLMVSDFESREIKYVSAYSEELVGYQADGLLGQNVQQLLTKSSHIFFESYVNPLLKKNQKCDEVHLFLTTCEDKRVPCIANVSKREHGVCWSIMPAVSRDKMYQELIDTRDHLEEKTEALSHLSRIDPLTQLLNRRALMHDLTQLLENNKRLEHDAVHLGFLLIDIDHFKKINDQFGHQEGDKVIKSLSALLTSTTRNVDLVARWGGEEFLLVLFNSNPKQTDVFTKRLHKQINQLTYQTLNMQVCIGVSFVKDIAGDSQSTLTQVIKEADEALYEAKRSGRNKIVYYQPDNYSPISR